MTIITHDGIVHLAWSGPCPGVESELAKARSGEDGYAVIDGAAWADSLPGDDIAEWDLSTGTFLGVRPVYKPTESEKLQTEMNELLAYLSSTDWYAIRHADTGEAIPDDTKTRRAEARFRISEIREELKQLEGASHV